MYEYKFVKYTFPIPSAKQFSFNKEYDESEYFEYREIIIEHAKDGWRLNNTIPFTNPKIGMYSPIGLDLIFERKIKAD